MMAGRWVATVAAVGVVAVVAALWFGWRRGSGSSVAPDSAATASSPAAAAGPGPAARQLTPEERAKMLREAPEAHLADRLNAPDGDLRSDVAIVGSLIAAYRSFYPQKGNPVGDNRDLVQTFQGGNPNGIILLPPTHRALNAAGELCDRWGTPFLFHAESGTRMEVRSAGPDKQRGTADDVAMVP
jgi:hypothetical protein